MVKEGFRGNTISQPSHLGTYNIFFNILLLIELVSEYTVERDMDLETVWLNGERTQDAGIKPSAPTIKRVITLR